MSEGTYCADWRVVYPSGGDQAETFKALKRQLMCNWSWDLFIWDLKELRRLMMKCPVEYNYLYVTRVLSARATYLVLNGPFECPQGDIVRGVAERNIQYAAIYRHLFIQELDRAKIMRKSADAESQDERFFQIAVTAMERNFCKLMQVLACSDELELEFMGQKADAWVKAVIVGKDGVEMNFIPLPVSVPVQIEETRAFRKIQPGKAELMKKVMREEPIYTMRERHGRETACDLEIERLCRWNLVKGTAALKYGEDRFQYFATMTNESKDTLYLVCADRTLRIKKFGASMPGSMPKAIHTGWTGGHGDVYEVTFDNGVRDTFALSFRAHKEIEKRHIPASVSRQVNKRGLDMWASTSKPPCTTVVIEEPGAAHVAATDSESPIANSRQPERKATSVIPAFCKGLAVATVQNQWKEICLPSGKVLNLGGKKRKRRELLQAVWTHCTATQRREFLFETVRGNYAKGKDEAASVKSDRFRHDVFKGDHACFDEIFERVGSPVDEKYRLSVRFVEA